jgi:phage terminase large subunit
VLYCGVTPSGSCIIWGELDHKGLISEVARSIKDQFSNLGHLVQRTIIDYAGNAKDRITGRSATDEFRRHGISCVNSKKDKVSGIDRVRQLLHHDPEQHIRPRLYVTANCILTIREFSTYRFDMKTGEPVKKRDESMDCLRYWVMDPSTEPYLAQDLKSENFRPVDINQKSTTILTKNARARRRAELLGTGNGRNGFSWSQSSQNAHGSSSGFGAKRG